MLAKTNDSLLIKTPISLTLSDKCFRDIHTLPSCACKLRPGKGSPDRFGRHSVSNSDTQEACLCARWLCVHNAESVK